MSQRKCISITIIIRPKSPYNSNEKKKNIKRKMHINDNRKMWHVMQYTLLTIERKKNQYEMQNKNSSNIYSTVAAAAITKNVE